MWQECKNIYHLFQAYVASFSHGFASKELTVIGVTGTDGKTTTASLIYHILHESGHEASLISTVGAVVNGQAYDVGFHVTTPSSAQIQTFLKKAVAESKKTKKEDRFMVLEVTSHALDQKRAAGIDFAIGVITNVTHEHLDYHKTYDKYLATKMKLLQLSQTAIVNRDDESFKKISSKFSSKGRSASGGKNQKWVTYGLGNDADVNPEVFSFETNLIGKFNRYNCLAAIAVCRELGVPEEKIQKALLTYTPPLGRQDIVYDKDFRVIIDFAHTPNAFAQLLPGIKDMTKGRLIHVFGSAAKRDVAKRPLMGEISSQFADIVILTAEDPRDESISKISEEIAAGIKNYELRIMNKTLSLISDRREAILSAISIAQKGDTVLLTGKGHEKSMNYGKGEEAWDEFLIVKEALAKKLL